MKLLLVLFLAVALQIQSDIAHIRVNLADPVLPVAGLLILVTLVLQRSRWPQWDIPKSYLWLIGLCFVMGGALLNGWIQSGEMTSWALYNKFTGVIILVCYFALGGWLVSNRRGIDMLGIFIAGFLLFYLVQYFWAFALFIVKMAGVPDLPRLFRYAGWMGNRNAFCVLMICATVFLIVFARRVPHFIPRWLLPLYLLFLPALVGFNSSRAGWIVMFILAVYFIGAHFKWAIRNLVPPLLCGALLAGIVFTQTDQLVSNRKQIKRLAGTISVLKEQGPDVLEDVNKKEKGVRNLASELVRIRNAQISIEIWREHPLFGGGLGAILAYQNAHYDPEETFIDVMDCTPIWLLGETGLVGLFAFVGFYGFIMRALWRKARSLPEDKYAAFPREKPLEAAFAEALIIFMLAFGLMSLFHEILYTRYLWVMMGMGAAIWRPSSE